MNKALVYKLTVGVIVLGAVGGVSVLLLGEHAKSTLLAAVGIVLRQGKPITTDATPIPLFHYIEVVDSCGPHYEGVCAVARAAPATSSPVMAELRTGIVLAVGTTTIEAGGHTWYKVVFGDSVRYPERILSDWYVAGDSVRSFTDPGDEELAARDVTPTDSATSTVPVPINSPQTTTKHILIDRSTQTLYAYDGDTLFMKTLVSTGLDLTPTPRGTFTIYKKTPARYMQGPLPGISDQYYDLPGVPWDLYFTEQGGAIHGAYWHNEFGIQWSHGCVNLPLDKAHALYEWAPLGTPVVVRD